MRLCVIPLPFANVVANKVIHSYYLYMSCGVTWLLGLRCALVRCPAMIEAFIGQFLLKSLDLFLKFLNLH